MNPLTWLACASAIVSDTLIRSLFYKDQRSPIWGEMECATYRHMTDNFRDVPSFPVLVKMENMTEVMKYADPISRRYGSEKFFCRQYEAQIAAMRKYEPAGFLEASSNEGTYAGLVYAAWHCPSIPLMEAAMQLKTWVDDGHPTHQDSSVSALREQGAENFQSYLLD